ncbi:hypothetical protein [Hymenobacter sp. B1770]|uniref:hypothetical protein n=1 Tax=Hymenobacter sp. B1770 TaxID=1718788 RepID=UPI003CE986A1
MKHALPFSTNTYGAPTTTLGWKRLRWPQMAGVLTLLLLLGSRAQATVIIRVGPGTGNPTIANALKEVPATLNEPYELRLVGTSFSENVVLNKRGSAANRLTIRPDAGVTTVISGTVTFGSGSAYTFLSGNNGTASRALTLRQNDASAATLVFSGDALHDVVSEVVVLGSASSATSGVVVIGNGVTTGNDHNSITQSFVANASPLALPVNLVYAANTGGGTNDAFQLTQNELFNFTGTGVLVAAGNGDQWNISGNSIFYNLTSIPTTAQTGIDFRPGANANDATIANNFIGGQSAGATGGFWENAGSQSFRGIVMNTGNSPTLTNEVLGNTVSNVSLTGGGSAALTALTIETGRSEVNGNALANVTNAGTGGVNTLVSRATTVLGDFSVSTGQLMVVENGLTVIEGSLTNAGILNHTGGDILISGDFINSGFFAQTQGDTEIKGDMLNSGLFNCSTGKVILTGNGPQLVSGGNYFNLEVNGSGTKTFTDDAEIFNGVQMLNGVLTTDAYRMRLGALANLNETETSYVLGRVEVRRSMMAGVAQVFGGAGLVLHSAAGSTSPGTTTVIRTTGTAPVGVAGRQGILRYFDISAPTSSGLNLTMTINYFQHELNGIAPSNLRFFRSANGGASWQNKSIGTSGAGFAVQSNGVNDLGRWTLGDVTNPLPVGLTAFRAERQGRNAVLTWATATEQNNRGFGVEVSLDGKTFREIGFVAPEGNSTSASARTYRFVDAAEGKTGLRYYRLRQEDHDGKATYYSPQLLNFDAALATFVAYPTQFGPDLTVELTSPTATLATLSLVDAMGRVVWQQDVAPGAAPLRVQPACATGSYVLTATVAGQVLRQRVVKE